MSDPIESSGWTGPPESMSAPGRGGVFTHRFGQHQYTTDYAWMTAMMRAEASQSRASGVARLAVGLLVSPLALWLAHWAARSSTGDYVVQDFSHLLFVPAFAAAGLAFLLSSFPSVGLIWLRKTLILVATVAVIVSAAAYAYVTIMAHRNAVMSKPERAFVVGTKDSLDFERQDGSFVIGLRRQHPREYGNCVSVAVLKGTYGFSWVRVTDWVPRQRAQLNWPLRREDCFSDRPLASFAT